MDLHIKKKKIKYQFYFHYCKYRLEKIVLLEIVCYATNKIQKHPG